MYKNLYILLIVSFITACGGPKEINLAFDVTSNGAPLSDASVSIDGVSVGSTDSNGKLAKMIERKYDSAIELSVSKMLDGHHVSTWKETLQFKEDSPRDFSYSPQIDIKPFVRFKVTDGKKPVKGAIVRMGRKQIGQTDESGVLEYEYEKETTQSFRVSRRGYESWSKKLALKPGLEAEPLLHRQLSINVKTFTESYDIKHPVNGVSVYLNEKHIGTTNKDGVLNFKQRGINKKGTLVFSAQGYVPSRWEKQIDMIGSTKLSRYFYSVNASPIRIGVNRFTANTGSEDIGDIPARFYDEITSRIKNSKGFVLVGQEELANSIRQAKLSSEELAAKGWKKSPIYKLADAMAFGSIARDPSGDYILELAVYDADGKLASSQIVNASSSSKIPRAAKEAIILLQQSYPLIGRVIAKDGEDFTVNLGSRDFDVNREDELEVFNPSFDKNGKIKSYKSAGDLKIVKTRSKRSEAESLTAKAKTVEIAAQVKRKTTNAQTGKEYAEIFVQGGTTTLVPVAGANIYLDGQWLGNTNASGIARVPAKTGKQYDLRVYKHGYAQIDDKLNASSNGERKEISLDAYHTLAYIESEPAGATIYVDNQSVGTTPASDGIAMARGFRNIRVAAGGEMRDFQEIIEVTGEEIDWRGDNRIKLFKDFMKLGDQAENGGNFDQAISHYSQVGTEHPDFIDTKHRLAMLYLDEKNSPDDAINHLEMAMALPEVKQLVYKHHAIMYTNMGHVYHEKANSLLHKDKNAAMKWLAKAIKSLKVARKNSRFFPTESYDAALHDTYYFMALSYHKLFQLSGKSSLLSQAKQAWQNYFDFFPEKLNQVATYRESMESAERYMEQLKGDS